MCGWGLELKASRRTSALYKPRRTRGTGTGAGALRRGGAVPVKPNLMGSAGLRTYIRIVPICLPERKTEHARDRCLCRRFRRSNCAYSSLFTLDAKRTQMRGRREDGSPIQRRQLALRIVQR
jgi:hypothetical protein